MLMNVSQVENLISVKISKNQYGVYRTSDNKEGIIKRNGEIIFPAKDYMSVIALNDHLFDLTKEDFTHATFDTNLNEILPIMMDYTGSNGHCIFYEHVNGTNNLEENKKFGICDSNYQVLLVPNYERIIYYAETYWIKEWGGCWMIMNEQLKKTSLI